MTKCIVLYYVVLQYHYILISCDSSIAHALNFPEILGNLWTTVLYLCNIEVEVWISLISPHNFSGSHNSISAVCKGKDVLIWLRIEFLKSVCYEMTLFIIEMIPFINWEELKANQGSIAPVWFSSSTIEHFHHVKKKVCITL